MMCNRIIFLIYANQKQLNKKRYMSVKFNFIDTNMAGVTGFKSAFNFTQKVKKYQE